MNCKEFQKLPIDEQRRILADEAKEFVERQLPHPSICECPQCLKAQVERLTGELEISRTHETFQSECVDKLKGERDDVTRWKSECKRLDLKNQASEQARASAVKELESCKKQYEKRAEELGEYDVTLRDTQSRLTKAEEALRAAMRTTIMEGGQPRGYWAIAEPLYKATLAALSGEVKA